ncbi:hypothetical protein [Bacillus wiedmannii]|uniref:hypothetical protein n=1 Tax=Bacillus wiedmannii TaxID=1890302 RepID=UPI000BFC4DFE|nr:hypothetical protein [Bacillus wiedmannii]PHE70579.1 hypothetical protein COF77_25535 [Bacillus wiedmannii]
MDRADIFGSVRLNKNVEEELILLKRLFFKLAKIFRKKKEDPTFPVLDGIREDHASYSKKVHMIHIKPDFEMKKNQKAVIDVTSDETPESKTSILDYETR